MTTGDKIKYLRIRKGMSQEELGEKIGVKKAAIYKYEKGLVVNLKQDVIAKLAEALNADPVYLLGYYDEKEPVNNSADGLKETNDIIDLINRLSSDKQKEVIRYARYLATQPQDD